MSEQQKPVMKVAEVTLASGASRQFSGYRECKVVGDELVIAYNEATALKIPARNIEIVVEKIVEATLPETSDDDAQQPAAKNARTRRGPRGKAAAEKTSE